MINQKEFVDMLYEDVNGCDREDRVTKKALYEMIGTIFDGIQKACKKYGGPKRIGRNPKTLEEVMMQPRKRIHFRTGKGFKEFLET